MPVKKRKPPRRVGSRRAAMSKEERASIKQAVSSLSGLVTREPEKIPMPPPQKKESLKLRYTSPSSFEKRKRLLLQLVVGVIMIFIGGLWVMNMRTKFSDAKFNMGSEENLWQSAKENFNTVVRQPQELKDQIQEVTKKIETEKETQAIKQILAENLFTIASSTSTTSTAEVATTTVHTTSTVK